MEYAVFFAAVSAICEFWHQVREPLMQLIASL